MRLLDKIDSDFLPLPEFERAVGALPLVSVGWVLLNPAGQMLLGHRRNAPARHWWFNPRWAGAQERAFGQSPAAGGGVRAGFAGVNWVRSQLF
jgi:hypothetical protein